MIVQLSSEWKQNFLQVLFTAWFLMMMPHGIECLDFGKFSQKLYWIVQFPQGLAECRKKKLKLTLDNRNATRPIIANKIFKMFSLYYLCD